MEKKGNEASTMAMVMLPQSAWLSVTEDLKQVKEMLAVKTAEAIGNQWVESTAARKELGVSPKTWQTYRDRRIIPFSQVGRKIYVRRSDLNKFMEEHYIPAKG